MPNFEASYTTKLFDRIHAAIDKLETRLDATNRRIGKLRAPPLPEPPPHQTPDPMYSQRTRRYPPHSQSRPRTPPYTAGPSSYFTPDMYGPQPYSCSDWEQLGGLSDYYEPPHERSNSSRYSVRRNAYRPSGELSDYYEPPHVRSNSSWYSARQNVYRPPRNAFNSGDQFAEQERPLRQPHCARQSPNLGWSSSESHQQPFRHAKNETCWDLPSQTSGRRVGKIRAPPLPEHTPQLTPSDRQLQQPSTTSTIELPPYAAPSPCQPLLSMSEKAPLCASPCQPQAGVSSSRKKEWKIDSDDGEEKGEEKLIVLSNVRNAEDEERCLGEVVTHTHSPKLDECLDIYVCGYVHELRDQVEDDSSSSRLVVPIGYTCENTRDFDYYSNRRLVEEEHCEYLGNMLLMDSKSETKVEEVCGVDASNSNATGVSISSIALLDEKHGVEEDRAVSHTYHQVSASKEIYWSCISDVNSILSTSLPLPAAALLSDVKCLHVPDGDFKCLHVPDAEVCKWRRSPFDDHISPPLLIFYGGKEGRRSAVRCVFDPGGDASAKLLLSTLFVAPWFPP